MACTFGSWTWYYPGHNPCIVGNQSSWAYFDHKLTFLTHEVCKAERREDIDILRVIVHLDWGGDEAVLLQLSEAVLTSNLHYGHIHSWYTSATPDKNWVASRCCLYINMSLLDFNAIPFGPYLHLLYVLCATWCYLGYIASVSQSCQCALCESAVWDNISVAWLLETDTVDHFIHPGQGRCMFHVRSLDIWK